MLPFYERLDEQSKNQSISVRSMTQMGNHAYWHFHQEIEIFYSAKGSGKCIVGDYVGRYSPGQLVIAGSFLPHDFNYADDDDQTNNILIHFNPQVLNGFTEFAPIRHLLEQARYGLSFKTVPEKTQSLLRSLERQEPASRAIGVLEVLASLCRVNSHPQRLSSIDFSPEKMDDRSGKRLNTVIEHITQNQSRPIHVEEMAQICNLSTPAFCRWFKQVFKCSFVTYMTERRIETACRLLETSNLGISTIGDRVGFESYSNFNRAFTKVKQIPPREYRRVHQ